MKIKLGEFIESVGDGIHGTPIYSENGKYYFINGNCLNDGEIILSSDLPRISENEFNKIQRQLGENTILLSINGTLGKTAYYNNEPIALGKSVCYINVKKNANKYFVNYVFQTSAFKKYMLNVSTGSTIKNFAPKQVMDYEFDLPSDFAIDKVAKTLKNIDDKIKLNSKIISELESMTKTIYDYWFLQFEFPNEEGKPYKSSGGKMVWNDELKREIPEGWKIDKICSQYKAQSDYAFKSKDWKDVGSSVLTIKCIEENGNVNLSESSYIKENYNKKLDKYTATNGNLIFAMSGNTIGKIGVIAIKNSKILINQRVLILKTNFSTIAFTYSFLKCEEVQNIIRKLGANSAQPNISETELGNIKLAIPNDDLIKIFNRKCEPFFKTIVNLRIQNQELASLRDFLLPLLMNGQVTFKEVE